jgi:NADH-quinone oxidoreductase subunit J
MNFDLILLFLFSISILLNALFIVLGINSIYSIFLLVFLFSLSTGLLLLIECEFMALIFVIIYIGAISVLFLFVILMLDLKTNIKKFYSEFFFINLIIVIFLFSFLLWIILQKMII